MSDLTLSLQQIHELDRQYCAEVHGTWKSAEFAKLLRLAGQPEEGWDQTLRVSLGDIALAFGPAEAWYWATELDWTSPAVRRRVVRALLPTLQRAGVPGSIVQKLGQWTAGHAVDFTALLDEAAEEAIPNAARVGLDHLLYALAAVASPEASPEDLRRLGIMVGLAADQAVFAIVQRAVAFEPKMSWATAIDTAGFAEREAQVKDLAAAFPPQHRGGAEGAPAH